MTFKDERWEAFVKYDGVCEKSCSPAESVIREKYFNKAWNQQQQKLDELEKALTDIVKYESRSTFALPWIYSDKSIRNLINGVSKRKCHYLKLIAEKALKHNGISTSIDNQC